jgi:hypothetical protein
MVRGERGWRVGASPGAAMGVKREPDDGVPYGGPIHPPFPEGPERRPHAHGQENRMPRTTGRTRRRVPWTPQMREREQQRPFASLDRGLIRVKLLV